MIFFEFYHLIIRKETLEAKYPGGLKHFIKDVPNGTYTDDTELASARFLKLDDINAFVDLLAKKGLHFHREEFYSTDFAVFTGMGQWWTTDWLHYNTAVCFLNEY
jgi:hypothetical protein